jgi:hypothetical protein
MGLMSQKEMPFFLFFGELWGPLKTIYAKKTNTTCATCKRNFFEGRGKKLLKKNLQQSPYFQGKKSHILPYLDNELSIGCRQNWAGNK